MCGGICQTVGTRDQMDIDTLSECVKSVWALIHMSDIRSDLHSLKMYGLTLRL